MPVQPNLKLMDQPFCGGTGDHVGVANFLFLLRLVYQLEEASVVSLAE